MKNGAVLYVAAVSICAGIALTLVVGAGLTSALALIIFSAVLLTYGVFVHEQKTILVSVGLLSCALGIVRTDAFLQSQAEETLPQFIGQTAVVEGRVIADPDKRDTSIHLTVRVEKINGASASGVLLEFLPLGSAVTYGNTVTVRGAIAAPQAFQTDTGHMFDYPGYLRVQGISAIMQKATVLSDTDNGLSPIGMLFLIKHGFESSLERLFPEPDNSLLEGVLLGERRGIPKSLNNAFVDSGLVHVVVLSGYNISIVSEGVFRALSFLPRTANFSLGGIVMILFAFMTGAGATTVRALIMALIALFARYMHRSTLALRSLAIAAAAMALWNPEALLYDPSFILSVLATLGLILLSPWVEAQMPKFLSTFPSARSIAASTISVQLFVLPALLYFTGILSFLSVPANMLALPVVPLAMLMGFAAGVLRFLHPALAFVPAVIADVLLKWMILVANTTASVPFGTAVVSQFSAWIVVAAYVPLGAFAIWKYSRSAPPSRPN